MKVHVITLFPAMFDGIFNFSLSGKAIENAVFELHVWNAFDYVPKGHTLDDRPYGGGSGMVIKAPPLFAAKNAILKKFSEPLWTIMTTPQAQKFNQQDARRLSKKSSFLIVCGRYEGVDQRFIDHGCDEAFSIGDYILSGGEIAAMSIIDAVVRLLPGFMGSAASQSGDTFSENLEVPFKGSQYTRPRKFGDMEVPKVLLEGNHAEIRKWRQENAKGRFDEITKNINHKGEMNDNV